MIDLKPCPFCGGKAKIVTHFFYNLMPTYGVECICCGAKSSQFNDTEERAAEKWNLRTRKRRVKDD